ncbi:MAG: cupin domain-containing protein [Aeromonadales bacterium]|jgi:quercetin dioxygenase-like cupin family protein|nr:cupin domain-containing protein [Aeromonadales bacterium]MDY2891150.1 cupin domain-containing protein [Succinivibrio sp.]
MFKLNDKEKEFRFGDSGPKYLMKGPRLNFAVVQFQPGQDFPAHYHNIMEENFYIIEGKIDIVVDGKVNHMEKGDFIHIEPKEVHYCINNYDKKVVMISTLGPFQQQDKVEVKDYKYTPD